MTEAEWLAGDDPGRMLRHVTAGGQLPALASGRKVRLFAYACMRQVWHRLRDQRSQKALDTAERFADVEVTEEELAAASDAAWAAARKKQAALLREVVGNPFRPHREMASALRHDPVPLRWITPTVLDLARAAYEERLPPQKCRRHGRLKVGDDGTLDPLRLAILADALEEAGCGDEALLRHLRGWERCRLCAFAEGQGDVLIWCGQCEGHRGWTPLRGPHARGCWALDLVLGKE